MVGIRDVNIVRSSPPDPAHVKGLPGIRYAGVYDKLIEVRPDPQHAAGGREIGPAAGARHEGVAGPAEGTVVRAHDELAVGVGLRLPDLFDVILLGRAQGRIVLEGSIPVSPRALGRPDPGIGVGEDGAIFLDARIDPSDKAQLVVRFREGGVVEEDSVRGVKIFFDGLQGLVGSRRARCPGKNRPGIAFEKDFPLGILMTSNLPT